jgi:hypothetical protein
MDLSNAISEAIAKELSTMPRTRVSDGSVTFHAPIEGFEAVNNHREALQIGEDWSLKLTNKYLPGTKLLDPLSNSGNPPTPRSPDYLN